MCSRVVYLFPTELEADGFRSARPDASVVISGVGMAATAATLGAMLQRGDILRGDIVLLCGIAGVYGDRVALGEVVEVVSEECVELPERFRERYENMPLTELKTVSSYTTHIPYTGATDADIENMEGASFYAVLRASGIRCTEIRAISNRVGEPFAEWRVNEALERLRDSLLNIENEILWVK